METTHLFDQFNTLYGASQPSLYFSPGRINLIGEHTDYNGGHVFPCAISFGTHGLATKRNDRTFQLYSENFPEENILTFSLDDLSFRSEDSWANYAKGMVRYLLEQGHTIDHGMNILIYGTIPNASGLSSSASLELLIGVILKDAFNLSTDMLELVKTGKRVENEFIGLQSGIMDQFAIGMGQKDKAIFLNCETLDYEMVPLALGDYRIVVMNTKKRRELADSKYNERREECQAALKIFQTVLPIQSLGDMDEKTFEENAHLIQDETIRKRAKHAVFENQRTIQAVEILKAGDLEQFGELMNESHRSLRDNYEVSCTELDTLVFSTWDQEGVLGARMTGAGFGGCAIALVHNDAVPAFIENVGKKYVSTIGYPAEFYIATVGDGARKIKQ